MRKTVLTTVHDGVARLWAAKSATLTAEFKIRPRLTLRKSPASAFSPRGIYIARFFANGRSVVTVSGDKVIRVWNVATGAVAKFNADHSTLIFMA